MVLQVLDKQLTFVAYQFDRSVRFILLCDSLILGTDFATVLSTDHDFIIFI